MNIEEALEEFNFFYEGDYITRNMAEAKDVVLAAYKKEKRLAENHKTAFEKQTENLHEVEELYEKEKEKNKKIEKELEKHIKFCKQEAAGSLNNEICHISLRFNERLLNILKEEE